MYLPFAVGMGIGLFLLPLFCYPLFMLVGWLSEDWHPLGNGFRDIVLQGILVPVLGVVVYLILWGLFVLGCYQFSRFALRSTFRIGITLSFFGGAAMGYLTTFLFWGDMHLFGNDCRYYFHLNRDWGLTLYLAAWGLACAGIHWYLRALLQPHGHTPQLKM